jgi:hypothetical protein
MSDQNSDSSSSEQSERIRSAFDGTRESLLTLEVLRLEALLGRYADDGYSLEEAERRWKKQQAKSLKVRYARLLAAKLPWWSVLRTPLWTSVFLLARLWLRNRDDVTPKAFLRLDQLLGRAEFSVQLSESSRSYLRQKIDDGSISRWEALSTVRSFGSKVSRSGDISPNPGGRTGYVIACLLSAVFGFFAILFASTAMGEVLKSCPRGCIVVGSVQVAIWAIFCAAFGYSFSHGRSKKVQVLRKLLSDF